MKNGSPTYHGEQIGMMVSALLVHFHHILLLSNDGRGQSEIRAESMNNKGSASVIHLQSHEYSSVG